MTLPLGLLRSRRHDLRPPTGSAMAIRMIRCPSEPPSLNELIRWLERLRPCWQRPEAFFEARSELVHDLRWRSRAAARRSPQAVRQARRSGSDGSYHPSVLARLERADDRIGRAARLVKPRLSRRCVRIRTQGWPSILACIRMATHRPTERPETPDATTEANAGQAVAGICSPLRALRRFRLVAVSTLAAGISSSRSRNVSGSYNAISFRSPRKGTTLEARVLRPSPSMG
jgi:hypothetical protein